MTLTPRFQYGSIRGVTSASFSLSRGTSPSVCSVTIPWGLPEVAVDKVPKPMIWSDGQRQVVFRDCIVNDVSPSVASDGRQTVVISILDRRWKWKYGQISGRYNVRSGGVILKETRKTVQELATLCLKALGETKYDVKRMPNDTFPYIDWDLMPVNAALDELCRLTNCHVSLTHDDRVLVMPDGTGNDLPALPNSSRGFAFDFGAIPGKIGMASAPAKWQLDFDLLPVGLDSDNTVKPIWELSYTPKVAGSGKDYWSWGEWPYLEVETKYRKLAQETVWRWYMILPPGWIAKPKDGKWKVQPGKKALKYMPGVDEKLEVKDVRQFFPLLDHQLDVDYVRHTDRARVNAKEFDPKLLARRPAVVWGQFYDESGRGTDIYETDDDSDEFVFGQHLIYSKSFSVDQDRGVLVFADPVVRYDINDSVKRPAIIRLRCATNFYNADTRSAYRLFRTKELPAASDKKLVAWTGREDVIPEFIIDEKGKLRKDNTEDVHTRLDYYIGYAMRKYETKTPANAHYPFLVPYSPDGLIAQVNYEIDGEGFLTTSIHKEREETSNLVTYEERRQAVQQFATMEKFARIAGAQDEKKDGR